MCTCTASLITAHDCCSTKPSLVNAAELASLLDRAGAAAAARQAAAPPPPVRPAQLRTALGRSVACVAAFAAASHLTPGVAALPPEAKGQAPSSPGSGRQWWRPAAPRLVLVGFARAAGDATLVATLHDVAVLPELQGRGLGAQLLSRLTRKVRHGRGAALLRAGARAWGWRRPPWRGLLFSPPETAAAAPDPGCAPLPSLRPLAPQLLQLGVTDVGLLAPEGAQGFFAACSFGDDPEGSTPMVLPPAAAAELLGGRRPREYRPRPGLAAAAQGLWASD